MNPRSLRAGVVFTFACARMGRRRRAASIISKQMVAIDGGGGGGGGGGICPTRAASAESARNNRSGMEAQIVLLPEGGTSGNDTKGFQRTRVRSPSRRRRAGTFILFVCIATALCVVPAMQLYLLRHIPAEVVKPVTTVARDRNPEPSNSLKIGHKDGVIHTKLTKPSVLKGNLQRANLDSNIVLSTGTDNTATSNSMNMSQSIPHILYFTHKQNILETKTPNHVYDNIMHTIESYRALWQEPNAPVIFLTDNVCRQKIQAADPRLLPFFEAEVVGMFKGDICRVATLYHTGGYYFDVDIRVVEPVKLDDKVQFCSCREAVIHLECNQPKCNEAVMMKYRYRMGAHPFGAKNLFQAFLAASPRHLVLTIAFQKMVDYYEKRYTPHGNMGVSTLGDALSEAMPVLKNNTVRLLQEIKNEPHMTVYYPDLPKQNGTGTGCGKIVHDPQESKVYFYSRIPGVDISCQSTIFNSTIKETKAVPWKDF